MSCLCLPNPADEGLIGDDRHQVSQLHSQPATKLQQPAFLLRCRHQPLRQPHPENPVLLLQIGHLSRQFLPSDRCQQGKNRMLNRLHRATVAMTGNRENRRESEFSYPGIRPAKYQAKFNRDLSWTDPLSNLWPTVFRWRCDLRIVTKSPEQNWRISTHSACRESECSRFRLSKRSSSLDEQAEKRSATPHSQPPSTRLPNWQIP